MRFNCWKKLCKSYFAGCSRSCVEWRSTNTSWHISVHSTFTLKNIPATSTLQKQRMKKRATINTSPMIVPTTIPAMTRGDKLGRAVGREISSYIALAMPCKLAWDLLGVMSYN